MNWNKLQKWEVLRDIKACLSSINESESVKESEKNFDDAIIEKIKKDFKKLRDRLSKPKIKEMRKDLHRIDNEKIKEIEKNLLKLRKSLSKLKKYHYYDDIEYKGIWIVKNLFDLSIDEYYYKPIKTNDAFNSNYIEYESKGDKNKTLLIKEYLIMIKPFLRGIINDHKTQGEWKFHSGNEVIDYKTQGEWKIQLIMMINFIASKDSTKSNNIEIKMGNQTDEIIEELFESLLHKYQERLEEKMRGKEFAFDSIDLLHYNLHKISLSRRGSYIDSKYIQLLPSTYKFSNNDISKFILLLRKGFYPYEYMESWERFDETPLTN